MATSLLLADDSPTIAKILKMALQSEEYEIRSVLTSEEAQTELKANPPNFFLVDLSLPKKNGYEFAKFIRGDSNLRAVKVILLSSAFEPVDEKLFQDCGADAVIAKPFDPAELRSKIRQVRDAPPRFPKKEVAQGMVSEPSVSSPQPILREFPEALEASDAPNFDKLLGSSRGEASSLESNGTEASPQAADANTILENLLNPLGSEESKPPLAPEEVPPIFPQQKTPSMARVTETTNATAMLDLSGTIPVQTSTMESILDLSTAFPNERIGTATVQMPKAPEPLSANAEALAAFFEAEIDSKKPDPEPVMEDSPSREDTFDASLSSIDWSSPQKESLDAWSSSPPIKNSSPKPSIAPVPETKKEPSTIAQSKPATFSAGITATPTNKNVSVGGRDLLFDTGNSNFRFSEDYIRRITKAFSGSPDEMILGKDASFPETQPVFPKSSSDRAPEINDGVGGGAWTPAQMERMDSIAREEVQMVVREIVERVVWEVIPELAENLIRKELDKVLKELEEKA